VRACCVLAEMRIASDDSVSGGWGISIRRVLYDWHMETVSVRLEKSGRILIPAAIRRELSLKEGSELLLRLSDAGLQISTRGQALDRVRARLRKYVPEGRVLSQELLDERREEAAREDAPLIPEKQP